MHLLQEIDTFLKFNPEVSKTSLGQDALNDPAFYTTLKKGRRCWPETVEKIRDWMKSYTLEKVSH